MLVTRENLYEQIWREPMRIIAARYAVSDVGLAKICRRADIPVPPRGHWAKIRSGKPSPKAPLPAISPNRGGSVEISPPHGLSRARKREAAPMRTPPKGGLAAVPDARHSRQPHPAVRFTQSALAEGFFDRFATVHARRASTNSAPLIPLPIRVSLPMIERALNFADALIKAAEQRGIGLYLGKRVDYPSDEREERPAFQVGDHLVPFVIEEKARLCRYKLSPDEAAFAQRSPLNPSAWKYTPTGKLLIRLDIPLRWIPGIKWEWIDAPDATVEDTLDEIIACVAQIGGVLREMAEKAALEEIHRREQERRTRDNARRQALERKMVEHLVQEAGNWSRADLIRRFVSEVEHRGGRSGSHDPGRLTRWLLWAADHAERIDPLASGVGAFLQRHEDAREDEC